MKTQPTKTDALSFIEFVSLMAMMMALTALSTDAMLPALSEIGLDLNIQRENTTQLVVTFLFLGLSVGQIFYGPVSDSTGRKPTIYAGYALYIFGCLLSIFAMNFPVMLAGRFLQGVGISGPRSVIVALIRDQYEGRKMARVMSFIMSVFILVPVIAPSLGQGILLIAHWRSIFAVLLALALGTVTWFAVRQPETLPVERRIPFSARRIIQGFKEVLLNRVSLGYTCAAGLISGAFLGYLNSARQIFQGIYGLGALFAIYFSLVALAIGAASFMNASLVIRYGMRKLSGWAIRSIVVLAVLFIPISLLYNSKPPLGLFLAFLLLSFFCIGILFGNLNSLAMQPVGHIAGIGAAVVGSLTTFASTLLGMAIGQSYNGTILPLVSGFALLGLSSNLVMHWSDRGKEPHRRENYVQERKGM
ncbi:MAG: multidrug effflux MFS transporter [Anaerolineales bacterium]|nr:multidrug effflux MFS transporter [Anaerolineales bacterium]